MSDTPSGLRQHLLDLIEETSGQGVDFVLAGGYGVLLRVELARALGQRTLAEPPVARATQDLDLLLTADIIVSDENMQAFRESLDSLGYVPIEGARYYQFDKTDSAGLRVKVDLHGQEPAADAPVKRSDRRIRPLGFKKLHAHRALGSIGCDEVPVAVPLAADGRVPASPANGEFVVRTPNLFSYWVLKLFALRDQLDLEEHDWGRRHAYDMYVLWATTNESQWEDALGVSGRHADTDEGLEAAALTRELFGDRVSMGTLRLRESLSDQGAVVDEEASDRFREGLFLMLSSDN